MNVILLCTELWGSLFAVKNALALIQYSWYNNNRLSIPMHSLQMGKKEGDKPYEVGNIMLLIVMAYAYTVKPPKYIPHMCISSTSAWQIEFPDREPVIFNYILTICTPRLMHHAFSTLARYENGN